MEGLGNSLQDMSLFLLSLYKSTGQEKLQYPDDHVTVNSCNTPNGNWKRAAQDKLFKYCCLSEWWIILTQDSSLSFPFFLVSHLPIHSLLISLHLFNCSSPPPSLLDCSSSAFPSTALSLQSSASVEGPGWSWGPSASAVPSPVAWRGRVPDGAQIQERPGAEAEDPAAGTVSTAAPGRPLPHRGLPWGDIWGKKKKHTTHLNRGWPFHTLTHMHVHTHIAY